YAQKLKECDNGTIKGVYGYTVTGLAPSASGLEQLIGVGIRTHDGEGNFTQVQNEKRISTPAVTDVQGSGTYTVNSDCTGTFTTATGLQARFVIVAKGKEIRWLVVSPPVVTISGHAIRQ
ncbi:MAG TPA: hypothetical protein VEQ63_06135, partial [Bryobacteraceae bacterium]|nr:hypothetical protein [Bryobacteraceae bacterium]